MTVGEPQAVPLPAGTLIGGRYRLVRVLRDAAGGSVYAAEDDTGQPCAVKLVHQEHTPDEDARRALAGSVLATQLVSPHLVPVIDAGYDARHELGYLVSPLLEHSTAANLLSEKGPLDPKTAVRIAYQACSGLDDLHRNAIVHRQLGLTSLYLQNQPDGHVQVLIADFNIAGMDGEGSPSTSQVTDARLCAPPETRDDPGAGDERSDVWSLAAALHQMLSGRSPHIDDATGKTRSVQEVAPWVQPGLAIALNLGLETDPAKRWPSATAFAAALRPFAGETTKIHVDELVGVSSKTRGVVADVAKFEDLEGDGFGSSITSTAVSSTGLFRRLQEEPGGLDALTDHTLAGKYRVLRLIGRGGMGAVFEVEDATGQRLAAKLIDRKQVGEGEEMFRRFYREAKAASSIESPHIVRTLEIGRDEDLKVPFIIMELLHGTDLKSLMRQRAPIDPEPLTRVFLQAARGLAAAHAKRIVHRDIKPANIFLHEDPDTRQITTKICDFGIAKQAVDADGDQTGSHDLTRTGGMLGSPMYMSPEQATNARNVDSRTDIWSLCISIYEALTATKPWAGRSALGEIILAICTQPVPHVRRRAPWVEPRLAAILHKGLVAELPKRWGSAGELIEALTTLCPDAAVKLDELGTVSPERRAIVPSSIPPPTGDAESPTVAGGAVSVTGSQTQAASAMPPSRRWLVPLVLGGLVVATGAGVYYGVKRSGQDATSDKTATAPTETASPTPAPEVSKGKVSISPADAKVTVDGKPAQVDDGHVLLEGTPGDSFEVVVTGEDGQSETTRVILGKDGAASPSRIALPQKEEEEEAEPEPAKPTAGVRRVRPNRGKPPAEAPTPAPSPPPQTKPEVKKPDFKDEW